MSDGTMVGCGEWLLSDPIGTEPPKQELEGLHFHSSSTPPATATTGITH